MTVLYKGFTTQNYALQGGTFSVTDIDLVNLDILSHIFTGTDDRVMMPGWGTIISTTPFEPMTAELIQMIKDDVERVINYDPRVDLITLVLAPYYDDYAIIASVTMKYIELNTIDTLEFVLNLETGGV